MITHLLIALCVLANLLSSELYKVMNVKLSNESSLAATDRIDKKGIANNVTTLLNEILKGYDRHLRPGFSSERTTVFIDIFVRTMGPISDLTNTYSFNCYFRQTWTDSRLMFNGTSNQQLSLSMAMLDKIWKPDTVILALSTQEGLKGTRAVGKCAMSMRRYPLDRQACRLIIGSYAFSTDELLYEWKIMGTDRGVQMDYESISDLPQFSMTGFEVLNSTDMLRDRNYSALEVRFFFHRHFGYFLMNFYVPCTLIVLLCWVALWTNREATGDRIGMGITSVLTMVLITNDSKSDVPKVNFPTALDIYIWICYTTLLVCMIEFTVVHYYTKFNTGDPEIQAIEREKMRRIISRIPKSAVMSSRRTNRMLAGPISNKAIVSGKV
ncbi:Neurotransmitter-gated ion-channel ligand binding domain protein [Dictyocaulus viviparus]|uniref:Neurotransmitter-gated ion-channel ligand binding domain protein n=1 Tax=Dictyocaulus viviparus TaxID=29172 RepID=A0A0D8YC50_DICVI|nr:Neurotransmitter-gated ion-channel ligand binding domain protein [Dictyocaulus viviparus]